MDIGDVVFSNRPVFRVFVCSRYKRPFEAARTTVPALVGARPCIDKRLAESIDTSFVLATYWSRERVTAASSSTALGSNGGFALLCTLFDRTASAEVV
jgi:hypothetical protein